MVRSSSKDESYSPKVELWAHKNQNLGLDVGHGVFPLRAWISHINPSSKLKQTSLWGRALDSDLNIKQRRRSARESHLWPMVCPHMEDNDEALWSETQVSLLQLWNGEDTMMFSGVLPLELDLEAGLESGASHSLNRVTKLQAGQGWHSKSWLCARPAQFYRSNHRFSVKCELQHWTDHPERLGASHCMPWS